MLEESYLYKRMYLYLFNRITDALEYKTIEEIKESLMKAQCETEDIYIEKEEDLYKLQGSKYVQSNLCNTIKQAKEFLRTYPHIACFSETPTSPPMWAHYADLHKGFVLEYDFKDYFTPCLNCKNTCRFRHYELLYPVIYTKTRFNAKDFFSSYWSHVILMNAPVNVFIPKDDELAIYKTLIHKSKDWEYEKEWRIISHCEAYPMIKQRPIAIYLGAQMEDSNRNHLIKIAQKLKIKIFIMDIDITNPEYKMTPKECKSYRI